MIESHHIDLEDSATEGIDVLVGWLESRERKALMLSAGTTRIWISLNQARTLANTILTTLEECHDNP